MVCEMVRAAACAAALCLGPAALLGISGCTAADARDAQEAGESERKQHRDESIAPARTGVLLVSHGSRSPQWRQMLLDFHTDVETQLLALPGVHGVKSAFMEYSEPSIASQLRAFDDEGYDAVVLVPLLLTVSSHSFDDIPTIVGLKEDAASLLTLKAEGVERYAPSATLTITPLLDFSTLLESNLPGRIHGLSRQPDREGVVLVAYGSQEYSEEWELFFNRLGDRVREETGVAAVRHCWCGHLVHYSPQPTADAIRETLRTCDRAIIIPVLVARDEYFQEHVIAAAVKQVGSSERVAYANDAILPDNNLKAWVVAAVRDVMLAGRKGVPSRGEARP